MAHKLRTYMDGMGNAVDINFTTSNAITVGGSGCDVLGDSNGDGVLNILDVVLLVNIILAAGEADCADVNSDGTLNILDVVLLVNIILAG